MSNPLATNAPQPSKGTPKYLEVDKHSRPLIGQVPKTVEVYTGAGGVSVVPTGTDVFFVNSTLATGALVCDFTAAADFRNMIGRSCTFVVAPEATTVVTINIPVGTRFLSLVAGIDTLATLNLAVATNTGERTLRWLDATTVLVQ